MCWVTAVLQDAPPVPPPSSVACFPLAPLFPDTTATVWGALILPVLVLGPLAIPTVPPPVIPPLLRALPMDRLMVSGPEASVPRTFSTDYLLLDSHGVNSARVAVRGALTTHRVYNTLTPRLVLTVLRCQAR